MKWEDEEDVIARANLDNAGLGASVWCRDAVRARKLARQLETGTVVSVHHLLFFPYLLSLSSLSLSPT